MMQSITRRRRRLGISLMVVLGLMSAACGGDDAGTTTTAATTAATESVDAETTTTAAPVTTATTTAASESIDGGPALERIREAGFVTIAIGNEPPYTQMNADGTVTGMIPDLVKLVMAGLGVPEVTGIVTSYESMIPGLVAGQWDLVAAGLSQTAERCATVLFSQPDTVSDESMVSDPAKNITIDSFQGIIDDPDIRLVAIPGNVEEQIALRFGVPEAQLVPAPDLTSAVEAVIAGRGEVTIAPTLSLSSMPAVEDLRVVRVSDGIVFGTGITFRKEDIAFRDAFDIVFDQLKQDGTFVALSEEWGFDGELAARTTRADIEPTCAG